jgi:hypothetical protein
VTPDAVIQALAELAADAYINATEPERRWHAVARAMVEAIAVHTGQPAESILSVLANPKQAQGAADVTLGGSPA